MNHGQTIGEWLNWDFEGNGDLEIQDKNGRRIYYERSNGFWRKREYDSEDNLIYYETSNGEIIDNRPPEIITHTNGRKYQLIP